MNPNLGIPLATNERSFSPREAARQIGNWNIAAISGGRIGTDEHGALILPVGQGYRVRVTLAADDTYTVERVSHRAGVSTVRGVMTGVYCDALGEIAYQASSYRSYRFGDA